MSTLILALLPLARAEEPPAEEPATSEATHATPVLDQLRGTWFVTSTIDGQERVAWACKGHPTTFEMDDAAIIITTGDEPLGGAVKGTVARGDQLVLTTTLAACSGSKEVAVSWADDGHHILAIERCEGSPRSVRAVRDQSAGVAVVRQCCDAAGKGLRYVSTEEPCPAGYTGQKPTPLRR
ncbi:MAG: hypothetical protein KC621_05315 [Myxococcales bacterium]|nr:hypothetical protein [Myxococcales bacterium]